MLLHADHGESRYPDNFLKYQLRSSFGVAKDRLGHESHGCILGISNSAQTVFSDSSGRLQYAGKFAHVPLLEYDPIKPGEWQRASIAGIVLLQIRRYKHLQILHCGAWPRLDYQADLAQLVPCGLSVQSRELRLRPHSSLAHAAIYHVRLRRLRCRTKQPT